MVNKQQFLSWIRDPRAISAKDLDDLHEITSAYPFCNIAHALTAKGYHNIHSEEFTGKLHRAAIYATNRGVLKQLIEDTPEEAPYPENRAPETEIAGKKEEENIVQKRKQVNQGEKITAPEVTDTEKLHTELQENLKQLHQHRNAQNERLRQQTELIDQFIEKDPKIAKPDLNQLDQKKQEDLSLKSQRIKDDIASENLALIMARQGKTGKAINIYQKLILKFPEKKAYFASRIEELKKK